MNSYEWKSANYTLFIAAIDPIEALLYKHLDDIVALALGHGGVVPQLGASQHSVVGQRGGRHGTLVQLGAEGAQDKVGQEVNTPLVRLSHTAASPYDRLQHEEASH